MKKIVSVLIICVMLWSSLGMSAMAISSETEDGPENTKEIVNTTQEQSEKKIFCKATTEDEFESDSLIVVFKNTESRKLKSFSAKSFPEISAKSVKDLTSGAKNRIEKQRVRVDRISRGLYVSSNATTDELYVDENKFHQIVKIDLGVKSKENVLACIKKLEVRDDVLMAFPNYLFEPTTIVTPNDSYYQSQWAIDQIDLPEAWAITTGNSAVKVGVLDSGIDRTHPDLVNRYNSDLSKDFTSTNSPDIDIHGHGTQVAGIIGAQANNGRGITGVCWNVSLVSMKISEYNANGKLNANWASVTNAINYAIEKNIPILNFSYCGPNTVTTELEIAMGNYSGLFVCTTSNERVDVSNVNYGYYNYNSDNTIVVAGTNSNDVLFTFYKDGVLKGSSYSATKVHLAAPGDDIITTNKGGGYITTYGTSMAAPYVAGVAALLKSKYPTMDGKGLKYYIEKNVDVIPALNGKVKTGGRLNAYEALTNPENFTIVFDANGGGGSMGQQNVMYGCSTALNRNTLGKAGCAFKGWYAQRTDTGKWYYSDGNWYTEGSQPAGCTKYLYRDEQKVARTTTGGKSVRMYAQWEKKYTLEFVGNNATSGGTVRPMTIVSGNSYYMYGGAYSRTGCTLDHWYAKDSEGKHYFASATEKAWYPLLNKPSGYTRIDFAQNQIITTEDFVGLDYDETIYMYAYWEPNSGILGDADMNGVINTADATYIQKVAAGLVSFTDNNQYILADVNFDGNVTSADATLIQKYVGGLVDEFGN